MAMEPFVQTSKALTNALVKVAAAVEIRVKERILILPSHCRMGHVNQTDSRPKFYQRQPLILKLS